MKRPLTIYVIGKKYNVKGGFVYSNPHGGNKKF